MVAAHSVGGRDVLLENILVTKTGKIGIIRTMRVVIIIKGCLKIDSRIKRFNNNPLGASSSRTV